MKKTTLVIALAFGVSSAFAQGLTSKKGEPILPEAGDWAIGFDASPLLHFVGNAFNGSVNNSSPTAPFSGKNMEITGKMFKDATTAYRAKVRIGFGSTTTSAKDATVPAATPATYVNDEKIASYNNITLGAGIEKRRGKTRLQGFYGAEALLNFAGSKTKYNYGNALSATNTSHSNSFGQGAGVTENKTGSTFGFTARGFIGVEYFVLPKISIGAEYGWGLGFSSTGEGSASVESWNGTTTVSTSMPTGKSSSFLIDTDNSGGAATIIFHF